MADEPEKKTADEHGYTATDERKGSIQETDGLAILGYAAHTT